MIALCSALNISLYLIHRKKFAPQFRWVPTIILEKTSWRFDNFHILERFSNECLKTKTEMISTANHRPKKNITRSQSVIGEKTRDMLEARENSDDKVAIDLSFTSDWSRGLRKISRPMKRQMKGEPIQS